MATDSHSSSRAIVSLRSKEWLACYWKHICSEQEDFQKRFPVSPKMLICDRKMIFYLFIFEFIILLLCWQKPANASCSSNNARLPRWDIVISGKMSAWKWCLPLLSHLAKKQAPHFPTIFYSIKLTIKLRTSDRLNGKKKKQRVVFWFCTDMLLPILLKY